MYSQAALSCNVLVGVPFVLVEFFVCGSGGGITRRARDDLLSRLGIDIFVGASVLPDVA